MNPELKSKLRIFSEVGVVGTQIFSTINPAEPPRRPDPPIVLSTPGEIHSYQPAFPIKGAFVYLWQLNQTHDGEYKYWEDFGNNPPKTWFGNSLPDLNPAVFDPEEELYSGQDEKAIRWIVDNLTRAKMDLAISSWWGPGHRTDKAFGKLMDTIEAQDSPNPLLRVTTYFEEEGFSDPSAESLTQQVQYIIDSYSHRPSFLKVEENGEEHPLVFVYGKDEEDPISLTSRWKEVSDRTGALIVLRVNTLGFYRFMPNQPYAWHDYRPAIRTAYATDAVSVSPGFDSHVPGDDRVLERDPAAFEEASKQAIEYAKRYNLKFVLWTTANEDGEGTGFLPRTKVIYTHKGPLPDPNWYKSDTEVEILSRANEEKVIIKLPGYDHES